MNDFLLLTIFIFIVTMTVFLFAWRQENKRTERR